ncbi:hypothetical protein [Larkinella soli]|uniref:hypothetical protein n=1 Tax=Larkinella soli TaxID=1770527 RepID=UPI000FFB27E0|nr:hypothetical protein [Larkinella soli]
MNAPLNFTEPEIKLRLGRIRTILDSGVLDAPNSPEDGLETAFVEVIDHLDDLLRQSDRMGYRVNFFEEVGVEGRIQDITALVAEVRQKISEFSGKQTTPFSDPRFHRYQDRGAGYFTNGAFFACDYEGETAFFVDNLRIYLERHIKRAVGEVYLNLQKLYPLLSR